MMKNNDELRELYNTALHKVHASDELWRKVENMNNEKVKNKKIIVLRRALCVAAAVVVLFVLSNVVALAATGETWIARFIWEEEPSQPADNVRDFFNVNAGVFGEEYSENAAENYYGGTYLDGETQVILLTDLSKIDEFYDVPENIRFEQCDYTYAELASGLKAINEALNQNRDVEDGYADDVTAWGLNNRENRLWIDIYHMDDEKIQWFKDYISDEAYLVFNNTD